MRLIKYIVPLVLLLISSPAFAAEIYGRAWWTASGKASVGVVITATCNSATKESKQVDKYGRYLITGLSKGATCSIGVKGANSKITVYISSNRNSVNLEIGSNLTINRR